MTDLEWGWPLGVQDVWCLRWEGAAKTLCKTPVNDAGRPDGFFPVEQPEHPSPVCEPCVWALFAEYRRTVGVLAQLRALTATPDGLYERAGTDLVSVRRLRVALRGELHD